MADKPFRAGKLRHAGPSATAHESHIFRWHATSSLADTFVVYSNPQSYASSFFDSPNPNRIRSCAVAPPRLPASHRSPSRMQLHIRHFYAEPAGFLLKRLCSADPPHLTMCHGPHCTQGPPCSGAHCGCQQLRAILRTVDLAIVVGAKARPAADLSNQ